MENSGPSRKNRGTSQVRGLEGERWDEIATADTGDAKYEVNHCGERKYTESSRKTMTYDDMKKRIEDGSEILKI